MISQAEFFALPEVSELLVLQMKNPFNSEVSISARIKMREIAKRYGVGHYFGPLS